jgi:hypothetical protein
MINIKSQKVTESHRKSQKCVFIYTRIKLFKFMLIVVCDFVQCAMCGVRHFFSGSVRQCVWQCAAVRVAVCGCPAV